MGGLILKFLLISKAPEATFKGVRIESEGRAGRCLVQKGPSEKIWLTAIKVV